MNCRFCGEELVDGANFCMFCGKKVGLICPECGTELMSIAKFCYKCGTPVGSYEDIEEFEEPATILNETEMSELNQVKKMVSDEEYHQGQPVWDKTATGVCDCGVGECDCDGSIWN